MLRKILSWLGEHIGATVVTTLTTLALTSVGLVIAAHWPKVSGWLVAEHAISGSVITLSVVAIVTSIGSAFWLGGWKEKKRSSNWPVLPVLDTTLGIEWRLVVPPRMWVATNFSRMSPDYIQSLADGPYHGPCKCALVIPPEADAEGPAWCAVCARDVFSFTSDEWNLKNMKIAMLEEIQRLHRVGRHIRKKVTLEHPSYRAAVVRFPDSDLQAEHD